MTKTTNANKPAATVASVAAASKPQQSAQAVQLDWNAEAEAMRAAGKKQGGSMGDQLDKLGKFIATDDKAALTLRSWAGPLGAQAFISSNRNCLAKLRKLAEKVTTRSAWCEQPQLDKGQQRKADASIAAVGTVLLALPADSKGISGADVARAIKGRYDGGAPAQAGASLDALKFAGIIEQEREGGRGALYSVRDSKTLRVLVPEAVK